MQIHYMEVAVFILGLSGTVLRLLG